VRGEGVGIGSLTRWCRGRCCGGHCVVMRVRFTESCEDVEVAVGFAGGKSCVARR
jgi:hypothetical protein